MTRQEACGVSAEESQGERIEANAEGDGDGNDGDPVDGSAEPVPFVLHAIFRSVALRSLGYSHLHSSGNC